MTTRNKSGRTRTKFIYQTEAGTILAIVFAYLNGELSKSFSLREGKQRAADAVLAFWKPYALRAKKADQKTVQAAAQNSVDALLRQVQSICDDFGVQAPVAPNTFDLEMVLAALVDRLGTSNPMVAPHPTQSIATASPEPLKHSLGDIEEDLIFANDEDLLGDLA